MCYSLWYNAPTMLPASGWHSTAVEREPCCAVALRRTAWSEHGMDAHGKRESDTAALCKTNGKDTF